MEYSYSLDFSFKCKEKEELDNIEETTAIQKASEIIASLLSKKDCGSLNFEIHGNDEILSIEGWWDLREIPV